MNAKIFRKVSLERLSSPERLDQLYRVTSPKDWLMLAGVLLLLGAGVLWSFQGSLATKVTAQGLIIQRGGVVNVVSSGMGLIVSLNVKTGDTVKANQVIARIAQPGLSARIKVTEAAIEDARRERERALRVRSDSAKLQIEANARERGHLEQKIAQLRAESKLAEEEIPVNEQLLSRGLITKKQSFAPKERLVAIEGEITGLEAQLKQLSAQEFSLANQPKESDIDMQARITELERSLATSRQDLQAASNVVSPYAGKILELKAYRGGAVTEGSPIVSLQPEVDALEGLVYVSSLAAKDIKPGMEAQISPGTVRREEYGFLKGRVTFVAGYPATPSAIMRVIENESLTQSIVSGGPVTEVRIALERAATPSGYRWSSREGPPTEISGGELCSALIVTREERPIALAFPALKEKLGSR